MKKRIALGVVAALAGGLLAAAPASAAVTQGVEAPWGITTPSTATWGTDSSTATVEQVASAGGYVEITAPGPETDTAAASWVAVSGSTITSATLSGVINTAKTRVQWETKTITGAKVRIATEAAGTITVTAGYLKDASGVVTSVTQQTFTITVVPAATSSLFDHAKLGSVETQSANAYVDADGNVFMPKGTGTSVAARVLVTQWANAAETTKTAAASTKAVTASVSGVGVISETSTGGTVGYLAIAAGSANDKYIYIFSDGRAGVAKVDISVDGKLVGSKSVTFVGAGAAYTVKNNNPHVVGVANETGTVTVTVKDANGVLVKGEPVYAVSDSTTVATITDSATTSSTGVATFTVVAGAAGNATMTFRNAATAAAATVSSTVAQKITKSEVATVTMVFDKATYSPGEKATLTVTLKDANGDLIGDYGDGTAYAVFAANATATQALQGDLPTASVVTASGVKTYTVYMPVVGGPVSVSAKTAAAAPVATAAQGLTITASASVVVPASAAETANAAAITALQTSVAALQTTVASLVASMTAQIKVINTALRKIAKKLQVKL